MSYSIFGRFGPACQQFTCYVMNIVCSHKFVDAHKNLSAFDVVGAHNPLVKRHTRIQTHREQGLFLDVQMSALTTAVTRIHENMIHCCSHDPRGEKKFYSFSVGRKIE